MRGSIHLALLVWVASLFLTSLAFAPTWSRGRTAVLHAQKTALVAGASGYIGRSVVQEAVRQGYRTIALVRDPVKAREQYGEQAFGGAQLVQCNVTQPSQVRGIFRDVGPIDVVVSCLASRSGIKRDAYAIDYQATLTCLEAAQQCNAGYFVLLSAFCVKNPWLQFQQAKLKFEAALQQQTDIPYTIVRPTAFFKSVSGQMEAVQSGSPYMLFGDGAITRCNPIAERDLAEYMLDCVNKPSRRNRIINLGGPDEGFTMQQQGEMLFDITNMEPKYVHFPIWIFDAAIHTLQLLADLTRSQKLEDLAETGRIGKYYAVESMHTTRREEKYGTVTLRQHYERIAVEGLEYDPYTTMLSRARGVDAKSLREAKQQARRLQKVEPYFGDVH